MQVSHCFVTNVGMPFFRRSTIGCLVGFSLTTSSVSAQTDCSEPGALDWLVGAWSVEGHDDYRVSWRAAASENAVESDVQPYLIGRGQLPVEVNYELQVEGDEIYLSRVEASSSSRRILSRCSEDYWLFGDDGGDLIARSGDELLALMRVPSAEERANAPAGVLDHARGVHLVRREVDEAGIIQIPLESSSERDPQWFMLRNTILEAARAARTD